MGGEVTTIFEPVTISLDFTFECPHCGSLNERSHLEHEVLFNGDSLGKCTGCGDVITLHLSTSSPDPAVTP
jgi:uncharacterized Zn finger protein